MSRASGARAQRGRSGNPGVRARQHAQQPVVRLLVAEIRKQHQAGLRKGQAGPFELWLANLWVGAYTARSVVINGVGEFDPSVVRTAVDRFTQQRPNNAVVGTPEFLSVLEVDDRRDMADRSFDRAFDGSETVDREWRESFLSECEGLTLPEFALALASLPVMHRMITHDGQITLTAPHFADMFQPVEAADALRALVEKLTDES